MDCWAPYSTRFMYCVYYCHVFQRLSYISTGRGGVVFVPDINKENGRNVAKARIPGPF